MSVGNLGKTWSGRVYYYAICAVASFGIIYSGYDQGLMGGVNASVDYIGTMDLGHGEIVTHPTKLGGIVAVYYLGSIFGCLVGGHVGDKIGRIRSTVMGCVVGVIGAALQSGSVDSDMMIVSRVITGFGTGVVNVVVPIWTSEVAQHESRGFFICLEFIGNYLGIALAYWLHYGLRSASAFSWRFLVAFQIVPCSLVAIGMLFLPESPRYLAKIGRHDEARDILHRLRQGMPEERVELEIAQIERVIQLENETPGTFDYWSMVTGRKTGKLHTGRRTQLAFWIQLLQQYNGIMCVTTYAPVVFSQAQFGPEKESWMSGLNNTLPILGVLLGAFLLDRTGRRRAIFWGGSCLGVFCFLAGGFAKLTAEALDSGNSSLAHSYGSASASFIFLFTFIFAISWLLVGWVYPTEIFPLECRVRGYAFSILGWAVGCGSTTLLIPVMFDRIAEKTFYVFGTLNFVFLPIIWAIFPETSGRTLEDMDFLFASESIWVWNEEKEFRRLKEAEWFDTPNRVNLSQENIPLGKV